MTHTERSDPFYDHLLCQLVEFLMYVLRENMMPVLKQHATEQLTEDDCLEMIYDQIEEWFRAEHAGDENFYNEPAVLQNLKMLQNLKSLPKGFNYSSTWCRRVNNHREIVAETSTATKHAASTASPCKLDPKLGSPYIALVQDMLSNDLTPEQRDDPTYQIQYDKNARTIRVTCKQRSWVNIRLRKNLGDPKVAYFILNHGIPAIMNQALRGKPPSKARMQAMLKEFMTWHASLLQSIVDLEYPWLRCNWCQKWGKCLWSLPPNVPPLTHIMHACMHACMHVCMELVSCVILAISEDAHLTMNMYGNFSPPGLPQVQKCWRSLLHSHILSSQSIPRPETVAIENSRTCLLQSNQSGKSLTREELQCQNKCRSSAAE